MSKGLIGLVLVGALAAGCAKVIDKEHATGTSAASLTCGGNQCTAAPGSCSAKPLHASCGRPVRGIFDGAGLVYTFNLGTVFPQTATWAAFAAQHAPGFDKWAAGDPATVVANYLASSGGQTLKNWRQAVYDAGLYAGVWIHFVEKPDRAGQLMAAFVNQLKLDFAIIDDEGGWDLTAAQTFRDAFDSNLDTASKNVARAMTDEPHHYSHFENKKYHTENYQFLPQTYAGDMTPVSMCWALGADVNWPTDLQHVMIGLIQPPNNVARCDADIQNDLNDLGRAYKGLSAGFSFYGPPTTGGSWTGLMDWGVNNQRAATRAAVGNVVPRRIYGPCNQCTSGAKQCIDGDQYRECGDFNNDGCTEWSSPYSCKASWPGTVCQNGYCVYTCTSQCSSGAKQCVDSDRYRECGDFNGDGCTEWSSPYSCSASWPGTVCSNGWCVYSCNEKLASGQQLSPGQTIKSCNGAATFAFQTDGNLVIYDRLGALWATGTNHPNPWYLAMQGDGNLVSYDTNGAPRWASGTYGNSGAYVVMQGDCNLVIYNTSGSPLWASNTRCR